LNKKYTLLLIICFFLLTVTAESSKEVNNPIIYVSQSGLGNFTKIQDGIDAANLGDIVYVYNGTYFENVVIDKSITLIGEDKNNTIIDCRGAGNTIKVNANHITIKNFTIQNSGLIYPLSGINLSSNYNVIENNVIRNNFYGLTLYFSSQNSINKNLIQNSYHCGIYISNSKNNSIFNNTIKNNFYNGVGIYYSSDNNLIKNNSFINNSYCGVNIRLSFNNSVVNNNFSYNNIGIHLPNYSNSVSKNVFINNNIEIEREFELSEIILLLIFVFLVIMILIIFYARKKLKDDSL
jgi:parallel beta-helix repeat protein